MLRRQLPQVQPICQPQPQHNCVQQLVISTLPRQPAARHLRPLVLCIAGVLLHPLAVRVEARGPAEAAALRGWEVLDEGKRGEGGRGDALPRPLRQDGSPVHTCREGPGAGEEPWPQAEGALQQTAQPS